MQLLNAPVLLSTAYLPNIQYVSKLLLHEKVIIDVHETYLKQSFRNRAEIYGANGKFDLSIPIIKPNGAKSFSKDILIDYAMPWQINHWRAIVSAYGNSPFFEIFEAELVYLYEKKEKYLIDFNQKSIQQIFDSLGLPLTIEYSSSYINSKDVACDFRNTIHPKERMQKNDVNFRNQEYFQVFKEKYGFLANLSFIDLMFNEGAEAITICKKSIYNS
jgi:hypothetical protein